MRAKAKRILVGSAVVAALVSLLPVLGISQEREIGRPRASITASQETVSKGATVTITWQGSNGTATLNDEAVGLTGTREVTVSEATTYTLKVTGRRRAAQDSVTIEIAADPVDPPEPPEPPEPVEGFSLSAVGLGSLFGADDTLSAAARDHELGAFLATQNGTWLIVADEVLSAPHAAALDKWAATLAASSKSKPAVIWHNQGQVLGIDELTGKTKADILAMAKAHVPATRSSVVIRGEVRQLGLLPPKRGAAPYAGPSVSALLKPIAAKDCPSVDLSSQVLYYKNQAGGTCVSQAFAGALEAANYCLYGRANAPELSPYFLANLVSGYNGAYAADVAKTVQQYGCLPAGDVQAYGRLPANWRTKAANYRAVAVYGPPDSDSPGYLRAALNRGFIACAGISVGSGFDPDRNGYISYARGAGRYVNHEIRVVGWNQESQLFLIQNSWGKSWGINGFAWLDEKFFEADGDMWVVVATVASPTYEFYQPEEAKPAQTIAKPHGNTVTLTVPVEAIVTDPALHEPRRSPCANGQCPTYGTGSRLLFRSR